MPALDTNVLVRLIVRDDPAQTEAARRFIAGCLDEGVTPFVPVTVMLELEWVLRSRYGFGKDDVLTTLAALLSAADLAFESERSLEVALQLHRGAPDPQPDEAQSAPRADFADCLHIALAAQAGESPLRTFDRRAARLPGARLIGAT